MCYTYTCDVMISIEIGSGQSTCPDQMGHLSLFTWFTRSNRRKLNNLVYILKVGTMISEQDLEHLSTSDCHSSEHNTVVTACC